MKRTCLFLLILPLLATSCSGITRDRVLEAVSTTELETVEYTVKKIVKNDDSQWYTIGDRKLIFSVTAYLKAGVDLTALTPEDIEINDHFVKIKLPHAKLLSFNMPIEEAVVEYRQTDLLRFEYSAQERNSILAQGEASIRNDAGIMDNLIRDAENNATSILKTMLSSLGFDDIRIVFE